ncbi:MAG TPA: hypothetical protein VFV56_07140 [Gaiellaceae bacterium]|jgi:hypothetical protein|nr:hypothetical protein [Gaiellaceae bacterium]
MKLNLALEQVQEAERGLFEELVTIAERHAAESDVYHVAKTLAARCALQLELLRPHATRYNAADASIEEPSDQAPDVLERVRRLASELIGQHEVAGMLLLDDLRGLYLTAHRAELAWIVLQQGAKAAGDAELLAATTKGCEEAERRWKWVRTKVKDASPQLLVAG